MSIRTGVAAVVHDRFYYRRSGDNRYYPAGVAAADINSSLALTANRIYAVPFIAVRKLTLSEIGCYVSTAGTAGALLRMGIYVDDGNLYPSSLLVDSGDIAADAIGAKTYLTNQVLSANSLYWFVIAGNAVVTQPVLVAWASYDCFSLLGQITLNGSTWVGCWVAYAYDVLPATFPGGATQTNVVYGLAAKIASQT